MGARGYGAGTKAVLSAVKVNGPMSVAELSAYTARDEQAVRRSVRQLVTDGLLSKDERPTPESRVVVKSYAPCNDHPKGPCTFCRNGASRYMNGTYGRSNPLPVMFEPPTERLAQRLEAALDAGTYGVHVVTAVRPVRRVGKGRRPVLVVQAV